MFLSTASPIKEITALKVNGLYGIICFAENSPIPWKGVTTVATVGIIQLVVGGLILAFTCGAAP